MKNYRDNFVAFFAVLCLASESVFAQSSIFESLDQRVDFTDSFDQPSYEETLEGEVIDPSKTFMILGGAGDNDASGLASLWQVGAEASVFFTNNAFNAASKKQSDTYGVFKFLTAYVQELSDKQFYGILHGGIEATRYQKYSSQDSDVAAGGFKFKYLFDDALSGQLGYTATSVQRRGFTGQVVALHTFSIGFQYKLSFGQNVTDEKKQWDLMFEAGLARALANPSDFEFYRAQVSSAIVSNLSDSLAASVQISLRYTDYDDFFESVNGVDRSDLRTQVKVMLSYKLNQQVSFNAFVAYTDNDSSLSRTNYEVLDGAVGGSIGFEFALQF